MKIDRLMQMVFVSGAVCVAAPAFAGSSTAANGVSSRCEAARVGDGTLADRLCGDDDSDGDGDDGKDGKDDPGTDGDDDGEGDGDHSEAEPVSF